MTLTIHPFVLGPLENNCYLLADSATSEAALVDPSFGTARVLEFARKNQLDIRQVWLTHAHFDHISGVEDAVQALPGPLTIGLHPDDLPLWNAGGGGAYFGFPTRVTSRPNLSLYHGQTLSLGQSSVEVRHAPGHTPGHVIFYDPRGGAALCGDVIFQGSIGRTDLPGGSQEILLNSIRQQVLTLPPHTRLLSGHGSETTVEAEMRFNPYL